LSNLPKNLK